MIDFFKKLFGIKDQLQLTGRTINMSDHRGWGNSVSWLDFNRRSVHGHLPTPPQKGDILRSEMQSGKVALFIFSEVEVMRDPPDQFFAKVSDYKYE